MSEVSNVNITNGYPLSQSGGYTLEDVRSDLKKHNQSLTNLHQDLLHLNSGDEKAVKMLEDALARMGLDNEHDSEGRPRGGRSGKSWLQALASVLGKIADQKAQELQQAADGIGSGGNDPSKMIDFQVLSQEFSLMMQTFTGAVKALGEGITAPASATSR